MTDINRTSGWISDSAEMTQFLRIHIALSPHVCQTFCSQLQDGTTLNKELRLTVAIFLPAVPKTQKQKKLLHVSTEFLSFHARTCRRTTCANLTTLEEHQFTCILPGFGLLGEKSGEKKKTSRGFSSIFHQMQTRKKMSRKQSEFFQSTGPVQSLRMTLVSLMRTTSQLPNHQH
ncbi:unnamed protein product [Amoebophrya sp. A120]|nr:unnamed protein product [Amoebophrya sp. A120]|eukprot:GSA120T00004545001.1